MMKSHRDWMLKLLRPSGLRHTAMVIMVVMASVTFTTQSAHATPVIFDFVALVDGAPPQAKDHSSPPITLGPSGE